MVGTWMETEIREQPSVLESGARSYYDQLKAKLGARQFDMVLLAARGSSDNAALFARYLVEIFLEIPVSLAAPSVFTRFGRRVRYPKCLAIGISQSGAAPDVAEVLEALREDGHTTLAITNTPGSRLTSTAEFTLLLNAGPERSVAATKTYSASLLALYELVRALGGILPDPLSFLPDEVWLNETERWSAEHAGVIVRSSPVFALGRGYSFAAATEAALKLMECALIPCKSYSAADFEHGPKALAGPGSAALSFVGDIPHLREQACLILEAPAPLCDNQTFEPLFPIWDAFIGQWMALYAARARALDPDSPRNLKKVTETV